MVPSSIGAAYSTRLHAMRDKLEALAATPTARSQAGAVHPSQLGPLALGLGSEMSASLMQARATAEASAAIQAALKREAEALQAHDRAEHQEALRRRDEQIRQMQRERAAQSGAHTDTVTAIAAAMKAAVARPSSVVSPKLLINPPSWAKVKLKAAFASSLQGHPDYTKIVASTADNSESLRVKALTPEMIPGLMAADHTGYLGGKRSNMLSKMLRLYVQQVRLGHDENYASEAVADVFLIGAELCPDLKVPLERIKRLVRADHGVFMCEIIRTLDLHILPASRASLSLPYNRRKFKIGEESLVDLLDDLIILAANTPSTDGAAVIDRWLSTVSEAFDTAPESGFSQELCNGIYDEFINTDKYHRDEDGDLDPATLLEALRGKMSAQTIWSSVVRGTTNCGGSSTGHKRTAGPHTIDTLNPTPPDAPQRAEMDQMAEQMKALTFLISNLQTAPTSPLPTLPPTLGSAAPQGAASPQADMMQAFTNFLAGKGAGRGGGKGKEREPKQYYNFPYIISTGKIWPSSAAFTWNTQSGPNGLVGKDCFACGAGKDQEMTYNDAQDAKTKAGTTTVPGNVAVFHRQLGCGHGGKKLCKWCDEHPDDPDTARFLTPMTPAELEAYRNEGPQNDRK